MLFSLSHHVCWNHVTFFFCVKCLYLKRKWSVASGFIRSWKTWKKSCNFFHGYSQTWKKSLEKKNTQKFWKSHGKVLYSYAHLGGIYCMYWNSQLVLIRHFLTFSCLHWDFTNCWSWKFGLKSWKPIGHHVYEPCGFISSYICEQWAKILAVSKVPKSRLLDRSPVWLTGLFATQQADETLNFEEQILEAAKSIAAATSALVKSASAAQRELVAQGKVGLIQANAVDDGQWSQGLISAVSNVLGGGGAFYAVCNVSQRCFSFPGPSGGSGDQQPVRGGQRLGARPRQWGEAHLLGQAGGGLHRPAAGGL